MKFTIGFLRRKDAEENATVRPSPEEAQKWSNSFRDLIASKCKNLQ